MATGSSLAVCPSCMFGWALEKEPSEDLELDDIRDSKLPHTLPGDAEGEAVGEGIDRDASKTSPAPTPSQPENTT